MPNCICKDCRPRFIQLAFYDDCLIALDEKGGVWSFGSISRQWRPLELDTICPNK